MFAEDGCGSVMFALTRHGSYRLCVDELVILEAANIGDVAPTDS